MAYAPQLEERLWVNLAAKFMVEDKSRIVLV